MKRQHRRTWYWFAAGACGLLGVVTVLTVMLRRLDDGEIAARRSAAQNERLRLALWRIDSWMAPQLAGEAVRPAGDYTPLPAADMAWTNAFHPLEGGEVVVMSPLVGSESPLFPLHFEVAAGALTSPQVPVGNARDACEARGVDHGVIERAVERLAALRARLPLPVIEQKVQLAEAWVGSFGCNTISRDATPDQQQGVQEYSNRQVNMLRNVSQTATRSFNLPSSTIEQPGPLVPVWLDGEPATLVFVRRVRGDRPRVQGFVVDWQRFADEALATIADLLPRDATALVRCEAPSEALQPSMLASVPARLELRRDCVAAVSGLPLLSILAVTWGVAGLGLLGLGLTLRAAVGYGDRRARFASAVTHELRTPLTTFRMYSEMLADGVVQDPAARQDYLRTLQRESDRLARVVENVLAWSRLEEGRFASRRERVAVGAMVSRIVGPLERRLAEASMQLVLQIDELARDAVLTTDEDAIGQVLFNLIDNAAKYAAAGEPPEVTLHVASSGGGVTFTVADHGPGIPAALRERVFAPFDRGAVPMSQNDVPGVGLGLALARGLARDLGGELRLVESARGACFELALPVG